MLFKLKKVKKETKEIKQVVDSSTIVVADHAFSTIVANHTLLHASFLISAGDISFTPVHRSTTAQPVSSTICSARSAIDTPATDLRHTGATLLQLRLTHEIGPCKNRFC